MRYGARLILVTACAVLVTVAPRPAQGQERAFDLRARLPAGAMLLLQVDGGPLARAMRETPFAAMLTHPQVGAALGQVPDTLRSLIAGGTEEFTEVTGITILEMLDLLATGTVVAVYPPGEDDFAPFAAAVELGGSAARIRGVLDRVDDWWRSAGVRLTQLRRRGVTAIGWPAFGEDREAPRVYHADLGTHVVFAAGSVGGRELIRHVVRRRRTAAAGRLIDQEPFRALESACAVNDRGVFAAVDLETVYGLLQRELDRDELAVPDFLGLRSARSLGYALGFRDGEFEGRLRIDFARDAIGLPRLLGGVSPVADIDASFPLIPASAKMIAFKRVAIGKLARIVVEELRARFPDYQPEINGFLGLVESRLGISLEQDVFRLGEIDIHYFSMSPPAGGLLQDRLLVVRSAQFAPVRDLLRRIAGEGGVLSRPIGDRTIWTATMPIFGTDDVGAGGAQVSTTVGSWAEVDATWTVVGSSPFAVRRYLELYSRAPPISADAELARLAREEVRGKVGAVLRGGGLFVASYNTVVSLANIVQPFLIEQLDAAGVDFRLMPIGETFMRGSRHASLTAAVSPERFDLYGRGGMSGFLTDDLAFVAGAGVIAGFLVPTLVRSRAAADEVACQNNLREIAKSSMLYADFGNQYFPHDPGGSLASLQVLVDFYAGPDRRYRPDLFVCRSATQTPATTDAEGKFRLTEATCSYELFPARLRSIDTCILAYDRFPHHDGRRNVVDTSASVTSVTEEEFQAMLARYRAEFGVTEKKGGDR